jgi:hypothetical protein
MCNWFEEIMYMWFLLNIKDGALCWRNSAQIVGWFSSENNLSALLRSRLQYCLLVLSLIIAIQKHPDAWFVSRCNFCNLLQDWTGRLHGSKSVTFLQECGAGDMLAARGSHDWIRGWQKGYIWMEPVSKAVKEFQCLKLLNDGPSEKAGHVILSQN